MRRLILAALVLVVGCSKSLGGSDVELTINTRATAIGDADLATVRALELTLSGSQNDHKRYDLTRALSRQERLLVHLTKPTGDLTIAVLARDEQSLVVALGNSQSTLSGSDAHIIDVDLGPPPGGGHATSAVSITPEHPQVFSGQTVPLTSASSVTWSVNAGGAGGTVDANGLYTAPAGAGTDSVVAQSTIYFGEQQSATIDVLKNGVLRYAGLGAGAGTVDGTGTAARVAYPRGLALDGAGSAYFSDQSNVIRKLDVASGAVTTVAGKIENNQFADGTGAAAGFVQPWNVAWDAARGALYVADNNTIRKVVGSSGVVTTLAGVSNMSGNMDGTGSGATFQNVWGLAYDGQNHLYASDVYTNTIRVVDVGTAAVTTLAGVPFMHGYVDGAGTSALFDWPAALALDGQGGLIVGDSHNQLIRKIDLATKMVSTVTGKPGLATSVDGPQGTATISYPEQLAYNGAGLLFMNGRTIDVASGTVTTIVKSAQSPISALAFAPDGKLWAATNTAIETAATSNFALSLVAGVHLTYDDYNRVDGSRSVARFNSSNSVSAAPDGSLFVLDGTGVRRVDLANDTVKSLFVSTDWLGGSGNLAVGGDGNIYLPLNNIIYTLLFSENYSAMHALTGVAGDNGYADGSLAQARFGCPQGIAASGKVLYVADSCNNVIRTVDLTAGTVSTLAGTANMGGLVDMPGAAARFNFPISVVADGAGTLYVGSNNAVRKIVITGAVVSTLAGGDTSGFADGAGMAAKFNAPVRLTLDPSKQNLYVADTRNTAIRKVTLGGVVTTVAGGPGKVVVATGALPASINEPGSLAFAPNGDLFVLVPHEESLLQIRLP